MSWITVKIGDVLKQYRIEHKVQDNTLYKQVSILNDGRVVLRGEKIGKDIGRKRQFLIDIKRYPQTLIFTRQLLLQGSIGIANNEVHNCIVTENMPMFSVDVSKIDIDYFALFIKSDVFRKQVRRVELTGSAQKSIHENTFLQLEIPLPSLKEQGEIVNLFSKFISKNLEIRTEINNQHEFVKQLRQAFLREAMQGRLVPQNPADGNATDLLRKIKVEKEKLITEKKLKKEKELPPIKADESPFDIPENWVWCRLGEVIQMTRGKFSIRPRNDPSYFGGEYPFIQIGSLDEKGSIINLAKQTLNEKGIKVSKKFPKNTIAIAIVGGTIGNLGVLGKEMYFTDSIIGIIPNSNYNQEFVLNYLRFKQPEIKAEAYQMAGQPNIKIPTLENLLFPMPPIVEQGRIVQKLEELMLHCNDLEASIKESELQNKKLLQQVLREALRMPETQM